LYPFLCLFTVRISILKLKFENLLPKCNSTQINLPKPMMFSCYCYFFFYWRARLKGYGFWSKPQFSQTNCGIFCQIHRDFPWLSRFQLTERFSWNLRSNSHHSPSPCTPPASGSHRRTYPQRIRRQAVSRWSNLLLPPRSGPQLCSQMMTAPRATRGGTPGTSFASRATGECNRSGRGACTASHAPARPARRPLCKQHSASLSRPETQRFAPSALTLSPPWTPADSLTSRSRWSRSAKPAPATDRIPIRAKTPTSSTAAAGDPRHRRRRSTTQNCSPRPPPAPGARSPGWTASASRRCGVGGGTPAFWWRRQRWGRLPASGRPGPSRRNRPGSGDKRHRCVPGCERSGCSCSTNTTSCRSSCFCFVEKKKLREEMKL